MGNFFMRHPWSDRFAFLRPVASRTKWLAGVAVASMSLTASLAAAESRVSFNRDIRPILSEYCTACHDVCPKNLPLATQIAYVRRQMVKQGLAMS